MILRGTLLGIADLEDPDVIVVGIIDQDGFLQETFADKELALKALNTAFGETPSNWQGKTIRYGVDGNGFLRWLKPQKKGRDEGGDAM